MPKRIIPSPVPPHHKWCHQCSTALPLQRFDVNRGKPDGRAYACRRCIDVAKRKRARVRAVLNETFLRTTTL
jgi:hypothetical protein